MKTVFITSFHSFISRNVLSTGVLKLLSDKGIRVVVFTKEYKVEYFKKEFVYPNLVIEGIASTKPSARKLTLIMKRLIRLGLDTDTARVEKLMKWKREGKFFYYIFATLWGKIAMNSSLMKKLLRKIDYLVVVKTVYQESFLKYRPDLVYITDVQNELDVEMMHNSRFFNVPILGQVRSWDSITSHGFLRVLPDILMVQNDTIRKLAASFNDIDIEKVVVVGSAHYDRYLQERFEAKDKKIFLESLGFSDQKKTILTTLVGDRYIPKNNDTDSYILELLSTFEHQIIVRFHPTVSFEKLKGAKPYPNMIFDRPGFTFKDYFDGDREIRKEDDQKLIDEIRSSDLLIIGPTSVCLDAAFFDKPIILINFHRDKRSYEDGIVLYDYNHMKFIRKTGGVRIANNKDEFFELISYYLKHPEVDREGRTRIKSRLGPMDGRSSERIVEQILHFNA